MTSNLRINVKQDVKPLFFFLCDYIMQKSLKECAVQYRIYMNRYSSAFATRVFVELYMFIDISDKTNRVKGDWILDFLRSIRFDISGYGRWKQTTISQLDDFIIADYELLYIVSGRVKVTMNGVPYDCDPGSLLLFEPFHVYSAVCLPGEQVVYYYLHFDMHPFYIQRELLNLVIGSGSNVFLPTEIPDFSEVFRSTYQELAHQKSGLVVLLYADLLTIIVSMIRARASQQDLESTQFTRFQHSEAEVVRQCVHYMEEHISEPLKIADVSKYLGVSTSYLYKVFMKVVRKSPSKYLTMHRMKIGERLLKQTNQPISEVAVALGFCSVFHFSKVFKQYFGTSPQAYRKHIWRQVRT